MQTLPMRLVKTLMLAALVGTAWFASGGPVRAQQFVAASCAVDDEIGAEERTAIEADALSFVRNFVNSNPSAAYELLAASAKQAISPDQFADMIRHLAAPLAPFTDLRVAHAYLVKAVGGRPHATTICGSLGRPEDWSALVTMPMAEQGHVLVEVQAKDNGFTFTLSLAPESKWKVMYFEMNASSIVGKTVYDILDLARRERDSKHLFNATVLYAAAIRLASRGITFHLGIESEIKKEMSSLQVPGELRGTPPFSWKFADDNFKILDVGPDGVGGKIYLTIYQEVAPWGADQEADQKNRALISGFIRTVPEYTSAFAGLVVGAIETNGHREFRTVYDNDASSAH